MFDTNNNCIGHFGYCMHKLQYHDNFKCFKTTNLIKIPITDKSKVEQVELGQIGGLGAQVDQVAMKVMANMATSKVTEVL